MNRLVKRALATTAVAAATVAAIVTPAAPAQANSGYGCAYPWVCVYDSSIYMNASRILFRYQQVTSYWQQIPRPELEFSIFNTRNDDVVYYKYVVPGEGERVDCVMPNTAHSRGSYIIYWIQISSKNYCDVFNG